MEQSAPPPVEIPSTVDIPTSEILPLLPENVLKLGYTGGFPSTVSLSVTDILPQLAKGRVLFSMSTLLASFPPDSIEASVVESGDIQIKMPLHQIVPRLPESVMQLPTGQVKQQIDSTIEVPFSEKGNKPAVPAPKEAWSGPKQPEPPALPPRPMAPPLSPANSPSESKSPLLKDKLAAATALTPLTSLSPSEATSALTTSIKLPLKPTASAKIPLPGIPSPAPLPSPSKSSPTIRKPDPEDPMMAATIKFQPPSNLRELPSIKLPHPIVSHAETPSSAPAPIISPSTTTGDAGLFGTNAIPPAALPMLPRPIIKSASAIIPVPDKPVPLPPVENKLVTPSKPVESVSQGLRSLLDIPQQDPIRLQDVAAKIRTRLNSLGVLVATEDGLPLVSAMPAGADLNGWSSIGTHVFRKLEQVSHKLSFGTPQRCLLSIDDCWITVWHDHGVYMVVRHGLEQISPEFEMQISELGKAIAEHCRTQHAAS